MTNTERYLLDLAQFHRNAKLCLVPQCKELPASLRPIHVVEHGAFVPSVGGVGNFGSRTRGVLSYRRDMPIDFYVEARDD